MAQDHRALGRSALEVREAVAARLRRLDELPVVREVERAAHASTSTVEQPRRRLCAVERRHVRVGDRDHVAAPVAVEPNRADRLADLEVGVGLDDALGREHGLEAADARHATGRQRPGLGGEEADRERLLEARPGDLVGDRLAEREPKRHVDEVDARRMPHEVGHLAARDPGRDLDDGDGAVRVRDQLRERDPVTETEHLDGARRDALRERRAGRRRPTPGRRGSSRRRSRCRAAAAGRRASRPRLRRRGRSRCRSSRSRRRTPRRCTPALPTRRAPRGGGDRGRPRSRA